MSSESDPPPLQLDPARVKEVQAKFRREMQERQAKRPPDIANNPSSKKAQSPPQDSIRYLFENRISRQRPPSVVSDHDDDETPKGNAMAGKAAPVRKPAKDRLSRVAATTGANTELTAPPSSVLQRPAMPPMSRRRDVSKMALLNAPPKDREYFNPWTNTWYNADGSKRDYQPMLWQNSLPRKDALGVDEEATLAAPTPSPKSMHSTTNPSAKMSRGGKDLASNTLAENDRVPRSRPHRERQPTSSKFFPWQAFRLAEMRNYANAKSDEVPDDGTAPGPEYQEEARRKQAELKATVARRLNGDGDGAREGAEEVVLGKRKRASAVTTPQVMTGGSRNDAIDSDSTPAQQTGGATPTNGGAAPNGQTIYDDDDEPTDRGVSPIEYKGRGGEPNLSSSSSDSDDQLPGSGGEPDGWVKSIKECQSEVRVLRALAQRLRELAAPAHSIAEDVRISFGNLRGLPYLSLDEIPGLRTPYTEHIDKLGPSTTFKDAQHACKSVGTAFLGTLAQEASAVYRRLSNIIDHLDTGLKDCCDIWPEEDEALRLLIVEWRARPVLEKKMLEEHRALVRIKTRRNELFQWLRTEIDLSLQSLMQVRRSLEERHTLAKRKTTGWQGTDESAKMDYIQSLIVAALDPEDTTMLIHTSYQEAWLTIGGLVFFMHDSNLLATLSGMEKIKKKAEKRLIKIGLLREPPKSGGSAHHDQDQIIRDPNAQVQQGKISGDSVGGAVIAAAGNATVGQVTARPQQVTQSNHNLSMSLPPPRLPRDDASVPAARQTTGVKRKSESPQTQPRKEGLTDKLKNNGLMEMLNKRLRHFGAKKAATPAPARPQNISPSSVIPNVQGRGDAASEKIIDLKNKALRNVLFKHPDLELSQEDTELRTAAIRSMDREVKAAYDDATTRNPLRVPPVFPGGPEERKRLRMLHNAFGRAKKLPFTDGTGYFKHPNDPDPQEEMLRQQLDAMREDVQKEASLQTNT
ncbi:hypothetical protein LTR56_014470 [Elasticomyces elasticus]|nr:hypothetical protein LTR56_014470 [Elasticomyces elasticus]KAK3646528.1 hypothetical protein LTR22_014291 [Elasticomyces elasticus]KAK4910445.1 hypothetical protein LTR49_020880 [Elasticomyces elasticus]KAK5755661.1 hypothetical protein LTS12_014222 [Elasticomyces elasticus]